MKKGCGNKKPHGMHAYRINNGQGSEELCTGVGGQGFVTKDSGVRESYDSGMVRDTEEGKPRFDLMFPEGVPYADQFLTRIAELLARGAEKYDQRNWEKATGQAEYDRFRGSALRHMIQWYTGMTDEDHAAACYFNLMGAEFVKWKMENTDG